MGFIITFCFFLHLLAETFFLVNRVVQLRIGIRQFFTVYHQFETFCQSRFRTMHFSQR